MPISPPSDIILGVANAADPQKYRTAVEQLMQAAEARRARPVDVTQVAAPATQAVQHVSAKPRFVLPQPVEPTPAPVPGAFQAASQRIQQNTSGPESAAAKANKEFEAFVLQYFLESMMPKDTASLYGSGTAGDFWKSMFAEHTGREMAQSNAFGIAELIANHKARVDKARTGDRSKTGTGGNQTAPAAALTGLAQSQQNAAVWKNSPLLTQPATTGFLKRRGS